MELRSMLPQEREHSACVRAITALARCLFKARPTAGRTASVSLVLILPGIDDQVPFHGMRLASYDEASRTLTIEAAVPARALEAPAAAPYVLAVAADAVDAAVEFFVEQGIAFDAGPLQELLAATAPEDLEGPQRAHRVTDAALGASDSPTPR
jgi:hypothetical protein